uniref:BTB domain-containing protein n=1 Tax=Panagrolaimus sp. ES5 TaxID=591445 RepID=A0AC34F515_9BILA
MASNNNENQESISITTAMNSIFTSKSGADCTFVIHGKELQAHKNILAARSHVFEAMLHGPMAPANQKHLIQDPEITYEDFEAFLRVLYTDALWMTPSMVKAFLHLGNFYAVQYFLEQCVKFIQDFLLDPYNCLEYATMGLLIAPTSTLLKICMRQYFHSHPYNELVYRLPDGYSKNLICPALATEMSHQHETFGNNSTKDAFFKKISEWAESYCIQQYQQIIPEKMKKIMEPIMPHFDAKLLLPITLATTIKQYKLIRVDELNDLLAD